MRRRTVCLLLVLLLTAAMIPTFYTAGNPGDNAEDKFFEKAELLQIKSHIEKDAGMGEYATVQGACTDGKFAYFAVQEYSTVILKYDMANWKLKKKATVPNLGHANDMAYNTKEKRLIVANNYAGSDILTILDPEKLEATGTVEVRRAKTAQEKLQNPSDTKTYKVLNVYSIAYQEAQNRYIVGLSGSYNFAVLDEKFNVIKQYRGVNTGYTRQGCDCDDKYIYFIQSGTDNIVILYDYEGKYVKTVTLDHNHEAENIFHVDKDFYLTLHYYGNSVQRAGFSEKTQISFNVNFDAGGGEGEMKPLRVHFGEETKLSPCAYTKDGYFFSGWIAGRSYDGKTIGYQKGSDKREWLEEKKLYDYSLYEDGATVSRMTKIGEITLTAFWIKERYDILFDGGIGEGEMDSITADYDAVYVMPMNGFVKNGYLFSGFTAKRDCDGRVYGYLDGEERPRWLAPQDAVRLYHFREGEVIRSLTYDGAVTFTAEFTLAFTFDDSRRTLLSYVGIDENVEIPDPLMRLRTIAAGAFSGNTIMNDLTIPRTVDTLEDGAITDCSSLDTIRFIGHFPHSFGQNCVINSGEPLVYLVIDERSILVGFYGDSGCVDFITHCAAVIEHAKLPDRAPVPRRQS